MHLVPVLRRRLNRNKVFRLWLAASLGMRCQDGTGHDAGLLPRIGKRPKIAVVCHPVSQFIAIECLYFPE